MIRELEKYFNKECNDLLKILLIDRTTQNFLDVEILNTLPRFKKNTEIKDKRVRAYAEVFTPVKIVKKMIDELPIEVDSTYLEITCGEAPFLTTRYHSDSGKTISVIDRVGILDKKLRLINELTREPKEWIRLAIRCFMSVYGYELQSDSLFIARINLLLTFIENYLYNFKEIPNFRDTLIIANIISYNIWQMDGLGDTHKMIYDWNNNRRCYFDE